MKLKSTDRAAMKDATMGCWWSNRAFPKEQPVWSGIANELYALCIGSEYRDDMAEAREFSRLAHLADAMTIAQYA